MEPAGDKLVLVFLLIEKQQRKVNVVGVGRGQTPRTARKLAGAGAFTSLSIIIFNIYFLGSCTIWPS